MYRQSGICLSSAIMVHPVRIAAARKLADDHPDLGLTLAVDPEPRGKGATLRTAREAWRLVADDATHHLVIQDDVTLCPGFTERIIDAITTMPCSALSFFAEWGAWSSNMIRIAALQGMAWAEVVDFYVPTQALVLPAALARGFDHYAQAYATDDDPDDHVLFGYLRSLDVRAYVSVPNIVEHKDLPSLVGNDAYGRRSSTCYVASVDAGSPPRHGVLAARPAVPYFSWEKGNAKCLVRDLSAGWRNELAADVLRGQGMGDIIGSHVMTSVLGSLPATASLQRLITPDLVAGIWTTAVAVGVAACGSVEYSELARAVDAPLARSALATLGLGGLRLLVEWEALNRARDDLTSLVAAGVRAGIDAVAVGKVRPFGADGRDAGPPP